MSVSTSSGPAPGVVSPTDAAFEGFALARREPRAAALWAAVMLGFSVLTGATLVGLAGPHMAQLQAMQAARAGSGAPDPAVVGKVLLSLTPAYLGVCLIYLAVFAVLNAAVLRAVFQPERRAWGYLRLGMEELRQAAVLVLFALVMFATYLALTLAAAVVAVVVALLAGRGGAGAPATVLVALIEIALVLVAGLGVVFLSVRLSLASALTFSAGRVRLFGSWALTRGRFWPIFGAYLLGGVLVAVLFLVLMVVMAAVGLALGGPGAASLFRPDWTSLAGYFSGLQVIYLLLGAPLNALWAATQAGAPARIYAQVSGGTTAGVAPRPAGPLPVDRSHAFGARE